MAYLRKLTAVLVSLAVCCGCIPAFADEIPETAGKVEGIGAVEIMEEKKVIQDVLQVVMPYDIPFKIIVAPGFGAWIESDNFEIKNCGEGDVIVKFKNIHYNFITDDNFQVAYEAEDVDGVTDAKAIYMKVNTAGADVSSSGCVVSNEAADSGEIEYTLSGKECENEENIGTFNFSGKVNIPEGMEWTSEDVTVSLEYEIYKANPDEHEEFVVPDNIPEESQIPIETTTLPMDGAPESTTVPVVESTTIPMETADPAETGGGSSGGGRPVLPESTSEAKEPSEIVSTTVPIIESTTVPMESAGTDGTNEAAEPVNGDNAGGTNEAADPDGTNSTEKADNAASGDTEDKSTIVIGSKGEGDDPHKAESSSESSDSAAGSSDSGSSASESSDSGSGSSDSAASSSDSSSSASSDSSSGSSDSSSSSSSDSSSSSSGSSSGSSDSGSSSSGSSGSSSGSSDGGSSSGSSSSGSSDGGSSSGGSSSGSSDGGSSSGGSSGGSSGSDE